MFNNYPFIAGAIANKGSGNPNIINPVLTWNFNNVLTMDFNPQGTENINDRPRINIWRNDNGVNDTNSLIYVKAGQTVLSPAPSGWLTNLWGNDSTSGSYKFPSLVISDKNNIVAGIDLFTHTFALPNTGTLLPPIGEWQIIQNPSIPGEIQYQYRFKVGETKPRVNIELQYNPICGNVILPNCQPNQLFVYVGTNQNGCPIFDCKNPSLLIESANLYNNNTWLDNSGIVGFGKWSFVTQPQTLKEIANSNQNGRFSIGTTAFFIAGHSGSGILSSTATFNLNNPLYFRESLSVDVNYSWNKNTRLVSILTGNNLNLPLYTVRHQNNDALTLDRSPLFSLPGINSTSIDSTAFNKAYRFRISNLGTGISFQVTNLQTSTLIFSNFYQATGRNFNIVSGISFYADLDNITGFGGSLQDWRNYGMFFNNIQLSKVEILNPGTNDNPVELLPDCATYNLGLVSSGERQARNFWTFGTYGQSTQMSKNSSLIVNSYPSRPYLINNLATSNYLGAIYIYSGSTGSLWKINQRIINPNPPTWDRTTEAIPKFGSLIDLQEQNSLITVLNPQTPRSAYESWIPWTYDGSLLNLVGNRGELTIFKQNTTGFWSGVFKLSGSYTIRINTGFRVEWKTVELGGGTTATPIYVPEYNGGVENYPINSFARNKSFTKFFVSSGSNLSLYTGNPNTLNWNIASGYNNNSRSYLRSLSGYRNWSFTPFPVNLRTSLLQWEKLEYAPSRNMMIAVGTGTSQGLRSSNGVNWTGFNFPVNANWTDITYGSGRWVAVNNTITGCMSLDNGNTWTNIIFPEPCFKIKYGSGKWIALPKTQPNVPALFHQRIGQSWESRACNGWDYYPYNCDRNAVSFTDFGYKVSGISDDGTTYFDSPICQQTPRFGLNLYTIEPTGECNCPSHFTRRACFNSRAYPLVNPNISKLPESIRPYLFESVNNGLNWTKKILPVNWDSYGLFPPPLFIGEWSDVFFDDGRWILLKKRIGTRPSSPIIPLVPLGPESSTFSLISVDNANKWYPLGIAGNNVLAGNTRYTYNNLTHRTDSNVTYTSIYSGVINFIRISTGILTGARYSLGNYYPFIDWMDPKQALVTGYVGFTKYSSDDPLTNTLKEFRSGYLSTASNLNDALIYGDEKASIINTKRFLPHTPIEAESPYIVNFESALSLSGFFPKISSLYTNFINQSGRLISLCSSGVIFGDINYNSPIWNPFLQPNIKIRYIDENNVLYGVLASEYSNRGVGRYGYFKHMLFSGDPNSPNEYHILSEYGIKNYPSIINTEIGSCFTSDSYYDINVNSKASTFINDSGIYYTGLQQLVDLDKKIFIMNLGGVRPYSQAGTIRSFPFCQIYDKLPSDPFFSISNPAAILLNKHASCIGNGNRKLIATHVPDGSFMGDVFLPSRSATSIEIYELLSSGPLPLALTKTITFPPGSIRYSTALNDQNIVVTNLNAYETTVYPLEGNLGTLPPCDGGSSPPSPPPPSPPPPPPPSQIKVNIQRVNALANIRISPLEVEIFFPFRITTDPLNLESCIGGGVDCTDYSNRDENGTFQSTYGDIVNGRFFISFTRTRTDSSYNFRPGTFYFSTDNLGSSCDPTAQVTLTSPLVTIAPLPEDVYFIPALD
jgi:hypothetical protein